MLHKHITSLQKKVKQHKTISLALTAFIVLGVFILTLVNASASHAGVLQDFYNSITRDFGLNKITQNNNTNTLQPIPPTVNDYEQATINAVKRNTPAVVSIVISKDLPVIEQCPYNPFSNLPPEFQQFFGGGAQFYQQCQKGTKKQEVGGGSGFIISSDGFIVTNRHVVSDTEASYSVLTNDGKTYDATVVARHPTLDIAVLKINAHNLPTVVLGDSSSLQLGQTVITIGNALGEFRNTVSRGVVSGLARHITASSGSGSSETIDNVIQTDAAINPGNSGGPLINMSGQVVGVNVAMVSGAQNIGFALPINAIKSTIESVQKTGTIKVAYLGVRYVSLNADLAKKFNVKVDKGALIKGDKNNFAVEPDSPAYKAGLKEGDVIEKLDGQSIDQNHSLASVIAEHNPGDTVTLTILRDGKTMTLEATLAERK